MNRVFLAASMLLFATLTGCDRSSSQAKSDAAGNSAVPAGDLRAASDYVREVSAPVPARGGDPHADVPGAPPLTAQPSPAPVGQEASPPAAAGQRPSAESQRPTAQSQPGSRPATQGARTPSGDASPAALVDAGGLKLTPPAAWKVQPTTSAMRKAQMLMPRVEGDTEDGELIVFHFGVGGGGGVQANIDRWLAQFQGADGKPLAADASKAETFAAGELKVTWLDVSGRYMGAAMGGPAPTPKDDYRMLAAIVEGEGGPWFIKATGPEKTMGAHAEAMKAMMKAAKL